MGKGTSCGLFHRDRGIYACLSGHVNGDMHICLIQSEMP